MNRTYYKPSNISSVLWRNLWQEKVKIYKKKRRQMGDDIDTNRLGTKCLIPLRVMGNHTERSGKAAGKQIVPHKAGKTAAARDQNEFGEKPTMGLRNME